MKKILALIFSLVLIGCNQLGDTKVLSDDVGSIEGKALYNNSSNHNGIVISVESSDGLISQSVTRSLGSRTLTRSVAASSETESDGSYRIDNLKPGLYTVYASSKTSMEKAVSSSAVLVVGSRAVTVEDLKLTPVGSISGRVVINSQEENNLGYIVSIAGTSFMAITDSLGNFVISDIPVNESYPLIISKGDFVSLLSSVGVEAGKNSDLETLDVIRDEKEEFPFTWKGESELPLENPVKNWAYYNTVLGISYIYNGSSWLTLAKDGADGVDGTNGLDGEDGVNGINGLDGKSFIWKGELGEAPGDAVEGWAYYNTVLGISFIYDGTSWLTLAKDGADGVDGTNGVDGANGSDGANGLDGESIIWKGQLYQAPDSPELNWSYYNIRTGFSYIFNGLSWDSLTGTPDPKVEVSDLTTIEGKLWKMELINHNGNQFASYPLPTMLDMDGDGTEETEADQYHYIKLDSGIYRLFIVFKFNDGSEMAFYTDNSYTKSENRFFVDGKPLSISKDSSKVYISREFTDSDDINGNSDTTEIISEESIVSESSVDLSSAVSLDPPPEEPVVIELEGVLWEAVKQTENGTLITEYPQIIESDEDGNGEIDSWMAIKDYLLFKDGVFDFYKEGVITGLAAAENDYMLVHFDTGSYSINGNSLYVTPNTIDFGDATFEIVDGQLIITQVNNDPESDGTVYKTYLKPNTSVDLLLAQPLPESQPQ